MPKEFYEKYKNPDNNLTPWMSLAMDSEAIKVIPELGEPGKSINLWFSAVHPD
jgi:hypothetical protein